VNYTEYVLQLWDVRHLQQNSFGCLKSLTVDGCHRLVHVIPSHLLSCFHNLEELQVQYCSKARVIFNINDENRLTKASGIFRLKTLSLRSLEKLEHVWDQDPEGIIGLQLLKEMRVEHCWSLKSLFPASVAKNLISLQVLKITLCTKLAEIFRKDEKGEEGEGTTQEFVFPHPILSTRQQLPSLKYSIHSYKKEVIRVDIKISLYIYIYIYIYICLWRVSIYYSYLFKFYKIYFYINSLIKKKNILFRSEKLFKYKSQYMNKDI